MARTFAAIGLAMLSFGCQRSLPHPPTFADFQRLGPGVLEDEKKLSAQVALSEAAMFLPRDIELIRAKRNTRELIGAALQVKPGHASLRVLTREAFLHGSNDPVVLTGIAKSLLRGITNEVPVSHDTSDFFQVLAALEQLESDSGVPLCLRAYVQLKQGDTNAARLSVKAAMEKPALRLHESELRHSVIQAAITAKYPRYTASMLALGTLGVSTEIFTVGKQLLDDPQLAPDTAEACLELARRYEKQATLFIEQLIAFSLQKRALEFLEPPGFEAELQRMQDTKEKIKKAILFLGSAMAHNVSERRWLAYFDTLFAKSESEAVRELAATLNYDL